MAVDIAISSITEAGRAGAHERGATCLPVCGHPAYVHAVAHAVAAAGGMQPAALDALLALAPDDAEGVLVPLYAGGKPAVHLKADHAHAADRAGAAKARALRSIDRQLSVNKL